MSRDERSGVSRETNIGFRCGAQVTVLGTTHVTGFGTTAFIAALPVSVGTPDVKTTWNYHCTIYNRLFGRFMRQNLASFVFGTRIFFSFRPKYHLCGS